MVSVCCWFFFLFCFFFNESCLILSISCHARSTKCFKFESVEHMAWLRGCFFCFCEKSKCKVGEINTGMLPEIRMTKISLFFFFFFNLFKADMV